MILYAANPREKIPVMTSRKLLNLGERTEKQEVQVYETAMVVKLKILWRSVVIMFCMIAGSQMMSGVSV